MGRHGHACEVGVVMAAASMMPHSVGHQCSARLALHSKLGMPSSMPGRHPPPGSSRPPVAKGKVGGRLHGSQVVLAFRAANGHACKLAVHKLHLGPRHGPACSDVIPNGASGAVRTCTAHAQRIRCGDQVCGNRGMNLAAHAAAAAVEHTTAGAAYAALPACCLPVAGGQRVGAHLVAQAAAAGMDHDANLRMQCSCSAQGDN